MDYYDFQEICATADCRELARDVFGSEVKGDRCAAVWRGGKNPDSVRVTKDEWYDHGMSVGGGPIQLVAQKFGGNIQAAQAFLGEYYKLLPKRKMQKNPTRSKSRYETLIEERYKEVARYIYKDVDGTERHFTVRLEKPGHKKKFVQGHENGQGTVWSLDGVDTVLYRLPEIADKSWVVLCEGEKSANALAELGLPSTTCAMGAGKWEQSYTDALKDKSVIICPDNDEPGKHHADIVARALYGKAKMVCILEPDESLPEHAGIDDWFGAGHTVEEFTARVKAAPEWKPFETKGDQIHSVTKEDLQKAAKANEIPFRNFIPVKTEQATGKGKVKEVIEKEPRQPQEMMDDIYERFLGFPRKVGDRTLFDHDKDNHNIVYLDDEHYLFAWIGRKSKKVPNWNSGAGFLPKKEMFINIETSAKRYESIARSPSWPMRKDVYYAHPPLPPPSKVHRYLSEFAEMFDPSSDEDKNLLIAFICAPLWYVPGLPRPSFIIDSPHGHGVGKSTLVTQIADLYGSNAIQTTQNELANDPERVKRRMLSKSGRDARLFLVDNVAGDWNSPEFASMVSDSKITGMAPYGRGEESRPNDLIYVITANTAKVSSEIADRSLYIFIDRPDRGKGHDSWKLKIMNYIEKYRYNIIADIIDMLENHELFLDVQLTTRFPEFESSILHPCCGSPEQAMNVANYIKRTRSDSNSEEEKANAIREAIHHGLEEVALKPESAAYLSTSVINSWGRHGLNNIGDNSREKPMQMVLNLAKLQLLPELNIGIRRLQRWQDGKNVSASGLGWNLPNQYAACHMVTKKHASAPVATWMDGAES